MLLDRVGRDREAVTDLEQVLGDEPTNYEAWFELGKIAGDLGMLAKANRAFSRAAVLQAENSHPLTLKAFLFLKAASLDSARVNAERALELDQSASFAWFILAETYLAKGDAKADLVEALSAINSGLAHAPNEGIGYALRGKCLWRLGMPDSARAAFERAVTLDENQFDALFTLAALYAMDGDVARATSSINRALEAAGEPGRSEMRPGIAEHHREARSGELKRGACLPANRGVHPAPARDRWWAARRARRSLPKRRSAIRPER
jgi:tetratricopeptide (TPR) repeat protein